MARTRQKKSTKNMRKIVLTSVIGSIAALGVAGAGYVTWSALAKSSSLAETVVRKDAQSKKSLVKKSGKKSKKRIATRKPVRKKMTQSASCKVKKPMKKAKVAGHKKSKHSRKKLRYGH